MSEETRTDTDNDTVEHLENREPEILTEEPLVFGDGETTTRAELEASEEDDPNAKPADGETGEDTNAKTDEEEGDAEAQDEVSRLKAELEEERKRKRAARRAERRLKERMDELEKKFNQAPAKEESADDKKPESRPKFDDYEEPDEWLEAALKWDREQGGNNEPTAKQPESPEVSPEFKTALDDFQDAHQEGAKKYSDYQELISKDDLRISQQMVIAMADTDAPEDVAYYLAKNPDKAAQIADMDSRETAREITRIDVALAEGVLSISSGDTKPDAETEGEPAAEDKPAPATRKKVHKASSAPDPFKPIDGGEPAPKNPDSMSQAEYEKWRNKQRRVS